MTVQLPSHVVHMDGSVSVQEAAQVLGCSEKTIRRRIKAGTLNAHQLPTSQGYEWRVQLHGTGDQAPPPLAAQLAGQNGHVPNHVDEMDVQAGEPAPPSLGRPDEASNGALLKALVFAERLQRENMELAGRVGFLQAKLQTAEEQILALSAGPESPAVSDPEAAAPTVPEEPSAWQRFLSLLRG